MKLFKFRLLSLQLGSAEFTVHFFQILSQHWKTYPQKFISYEVSFIASPIYKLWTLDE